VRQTIPHPAGGGGAGDRRNERETLHQLTVLAQGVLKAGDGRPRGAGSRKAGLAMALKLALASESHWRKVNAPHLVALVRAGIRYQDGVHVSAPEARERHAEQLAEGIAG